MSFSSDNSMLANQIPISQEIPDPKSPDFANIMSLFLKRMSDSINTKEGGLYFRQEQATFQRYFSNDTTTGVNSAFTTRNVYRIVIKITSVAAGAPPSVFPHGVSGIVACTHIYGSCVTDLPDFRPMPYASVGGGNIDIRVDNTSLYVLVGAGSPNIVSGTVVIEYLKNL